MATELDNFASALADQIEIELLEEMREESRKNVPAAEAAAPSKPVPAGGNPFLRDDSDEASAESSLPRSRPSWE